MNEVPDNKLPPIAQHGKDPGDDFLPPGGALQGALFRGLLRRLDDAEPDQLGKRVGAYRTVRELGRGGMGVVYLAERVEGGFEQEVALKFVRGGAHASIGQELFRRERNLLAALDHPHIARLIDGGRTDDGWLWFALERVDGLRIDRHVFEHRLDLPARLRLFLQACDAVAFAHQRLVIHRDIKPANILVNAQGWVKLLDFGIATLADSGSAASRALTPNWASPEQLRGEPVSTASDIFQLGILLRQLLLLDAWQQTDSTRLEATRAGVPDVGAPAAPPQMPMRDRDLAAIVEKCTASDAAARYSSVGELLADIAARLEHRPVAARRGGAVYRLRCYLRRHALGVISAAAVVALIVGLSTVSAWRVVNERNRAEAAAQLAQQQSAKATSAVDFLTDLLSQADPFVHGGHPLEVQQVLEQGASRLEEGRDEQPGLKAELLLLFGRIYANRDDDVRAVSLFERALTLLRQGSAPNDPRLAEAAQRLAASLPRDQNSRALDLANEAVGIAVATGDDRRQARLLRLKAVLVYEHGDLAAATHMAEQAVVANIRAYGEGTTEHADNLLNLGAFRDELGDTAAARAAFERAYRIYLAAHGPDHPDTLLAEGNLAGDLRVAKDFAAADTMLTDVLARTGNLYGQSGPRYAKRINDIALLRYDQGRPDEAEAQFRHALALFDQAQAGNDQDSLSSLEGLVRIALQRRRYAEALSLLQQWEKRKSAGAISVTLDLGSRQLYYANAYTGLARWAEADAAIARARTEIEPRLPQGHPQRVHLQEAVDSLAQARAAAQPQR
jgi:eukaryotic-like serine/threonine-protein kinase